MTTFLARLAVAMTIGSATVSAQPVTPPGPAQGGPVNPLWHEQKTRNYLPHMTWPEVQDLRTRTDMVIIPIAAIEQHSLHLPIGTDFLNGLERAKLVAQRADALVAPILLPGNSPYHMEFPGTISLSSQTIQQVYFEAAQSLMKHGFRRFLLLNSHGGNQVITRYIADRINQETEGIAVELGEAAAPFLTRAPQAAAPTGTVFDRHGGVGETSTALYMMPNLVDLAVARRAALTMPEHLQKMLPEVVAGDPTATLVFLAEGLKAKSTGKNTSTREMSDTGTWGLRDPHEATAEAGRRETENFVQAAVKFIERWKQLRPMHR
ncbi:MAG TPA: creatininase family protein [Vicinamibacterales bacterium]|nr:creatininase family protein [Vicinamibacterales bacterium]